MSKSGQPFDESLWQASGGPALITNLQEKVTQARLLHADILDIVAEMEQRGIAQVAGYSRLGPLLSDAVRISPHEARKLVDQAAQVAEVVTPPGTPPQRRCPASGRPCTKASLTVSTSPRSPTP